MQLLSLLIPQYSVHILRQGEKFVLQMGASDHIQSEVAVVEKTVALLPVGTSAHCVSGPKKVHTPHAKIVACNLLQWPIQCV